MVNTFNEVGMGSIPGLGTRLPHAVWHSQKIKLKKEKKKTTIFLRIKDTVGMYAKKNWNFHTLLDGNIN